MAADTDATTMRHDRTMQLPFVILRPCLSPFNDKADSLCSQRIGYLLG
jgi:hypothetical protein